MASESLRSSFRRHLREQALTAAYTLAVDKGWDRVTIVDIAEAAGTSRQMLYKEFGDKQGIGDALVLREAERFLDGVQAVLAEHSDDVRAAITAASLYTLEEAEASPLLHAVLTASRMSAAGAEQDGGLLPLLPTSASVLQVASERLTALLQDRVPELGPRDVELAVDVVVRLTVSYVVLPAADRRETSHRIAEIAFRLLRLEH